MKKIAIAGASLALAAMPLAGAFAVDFTDNITITVNSSCTLTRDSGEGNYTKAMAVNTVENNIGSSTFKVVCNNASGYSVGAVATSLSGPGEEAITYSAETPTAGGGTWTAARTTAASNIAATNGVLMSSNQPTAAAGETETVTYKASTRAHQTSGNYNGTMEYTLTQNS